LHPDVKRINERKNEMVDFLEDLVNIDSPSTDPDLATNASYMVGEHCERLGAQVEYISEDGAGDHVKATFGSKPKTDNGYVLLLCHLDTVWPEGETNERPFSLDGDTASGPGIFDMKGGTVQALFAIEEVAKSEDFADEIILFCNTDEEIGSPTSRKHIEELAENARAVLVLEPSIPPEGSIKTFRKGVGRFTVKTEGRSAHSGADHASGISAIDEMASQIKYLHSLTDYESGTTVNVGVINGGSRANVVPAECEAEVDVRVTSKDAGREIEEAILNLNAHLEGAKVKVEGGVERPPMERTPEIVKMYELARSIGENMGLNITEAGTGGASDGNFTAAMGVPTLDGLGAVGAGGHALDEWISIEKMIERTALLVKLLQEL